MRPSEAISQKDRQTIQAAWQVLLQKSSILGFNLNQGQWSYQQIVCPLFSRHLALLFASGEQGERSVFSAVIPEGSDENVRVLPILRRGYTPFQPAAISPSTIAEFNAIRAHEPARSQADWLTTSLCYAALAGSPVEASRPGLEDGSSQPFAANLQIGQHGAATARFMQVEKGHSPQQWSLQYDRAGQLVKVTISPSGHFGVRGVPAH